MATLLVHDPSGPPNRFLLSVERPIILGRDASCDLVLAHPSISRRHALIRYVEGVFRLEDTSTNGVFINGERVSEHMLRDGDELVLGGDSEHPIRFSAEETRLDMTMTRMQYDYSQVALSDVDNLRRLIEVNKAITTSLEREEVFELVLEGILAISSGSRAMILLAGDNGELEVVFEKVSEASERSIRREGISQTIVGRVVESGRAVLVNDVADDPGLEAQASIQALDLRSAVAIPLNYSQSYMSRTRRDDPLMGVIYVDSRSARRRFSQEDLDLLLAFSFQGAIAIENAQLHRDLQENYLALVMSLAEAVEVKDRYTRGHSELVSRYAVAMAEEMGLTDREIEEIARGGMLHDVGKIGIDEAILNKEGKLTDEEFEMMKMHPTYGAQILEPIQFLGKASEIVHQHHERMDGGGYPQGLRGEEICLGARIIAVCDVYEGITSYRPYRKPMEPEQVVEVLREEAGPKLDPDCVDVFLKIYEESDYKKGEVGRRRVQAEKGGGTSAEEAC
jgi:putative nucleotidyltransferase with HDIG domain